MTDKLIEALRCCGIRVGDKNCGECPVCATEEIKCTELMTLAADKLAELNDFSQSQTAKLLGHIAKKDSEINRLSQLAMMREGEIGDRDRELASKDKQLAAAKEALRLAIAYHSTDERQIGRLMRHYLAEASGPQEAVEGGLTWRG